jgi:hypothetical protein
MQSETKSDNYLSTITTFMVKYSIKSGGLEHGQLAGYHMALAFPSPFFSVQSYGLYAIDVWGGEFTQYQATCYVSKHTMVYDEGE